MSKILIIDDDEKILLSFGHQLTSQGYEIIKSNNATDGINHLRNDEDINLVLLDYIMPDMNGMDTFKIIKNIFKENCLPVIMMTFYTDYKLATEFIKNGGADFIEKTIYPESLQLKIEKVIYDYKKVVKASNKQREAEIKLKEQTKALENSNHELKRYVDIIAHDLKEPLRSISNSLQFLKWDFNEHIDLKANEYIDFAVNSSIRLTYMIQGLTDYANINNILPFKKVVTAEIINDALKNLKRQIEENKVTINIDSGLPEKIIGHKYQLIQLFQNLISNAIKFQKTDLNPIIDINCQSLSDAWEFSVTDNGIGFNKSYSKRIFDIFQRLHTPQEYQGSGIGLSICQKIIHRHEGNISATSEPNNGTTFTFTICKNL
ncbi:MAG: signal transduction histidine kinase [Saprospiraceae bacterium]|mgnify:CR=1 FL=1|jgi:signal transduction histidine kinase